MAASAPAALAALVSKTPPDGLTGAQVAERRSRGLGNAGGERVGRPPQAQRPPGRTRESGG
jgi:hypothetical protein